MSEDMALMIFAAGLGTRMGHLTLDRPKPLIEVGGRSLIDHALALADDIRPIKTVVNVHYKKDMLTSVSYTHLTLPTT